MLEIQALHRCTFRSYLVSTPFKSRRCIVPLSRFREPCYWGEPAGKEVNFFPTSGEYLGVACLNNLWKAQKDSEPLVTMTFLMRRASEYVMDNGHHRQPFFIHSDAFDEWMDPEPREPKESVTILRANAYEPDLTYEVAREMAPSWTSRQKGRVKKRDEQLADIEKTGLPLGV